MDRELETQLEMLVDEASLADVLNALVSICGAKADHLRSNWADANTAKAWETAGKLIAGLAVKISL